MRNKKARDVVTPEENVGDAPANAPDAANTAFRIFRTPLAQTQMATLARNDERKHRKVLKTLGLLAQNPRYPGLNSHKYEAEQGPNGEDVWESYVENNTPGAYRVFWFYGPESGIITVFAVTPHP